MLFKRSDTVKIGEKSVPVPKITIKKWRELFESIEMLPQLILSIFNVPATERAGYIVVVIRESFSEVVRVTSVLTGIDEEYIEEHATLNDLVAFYGATIKANDFGGLLKNVQGVLGSVVAKPTETTPNPDAD
jgi:hypothetical protein